MKEEKHSKVTVFILFLISVLIVGSIYFKINYSLTNFEEIVFSLKCGVKDSDNTVFITTILRVLPYILILFAILYALFFDITFNKKVLKTKKGKQLYPITVFNLHRKSFICLAFSISIILLLQAVGVFNYIYYSSMKSNFIEENYVDSKNTKVDFKEKRNLVFIMVESLETSYFTKDQNGYWDYELIPELYSLLDDKDSITFYNKNKAEGLNMIEGSSWTTASIVSNLSGIPIKVGLIKNTYNTDSFMNNTYALGDLLKDNGYHNEVISSARTSFGGLKEYFSIHGDYSIIDENTLDKYDLKMNKSDVGKWGFNDKYLFETAKKRLDVLSKKDEPFNLQLITIDTHFVDGFVGDYSTNKYNLQYENAYATESKLIYDFVNYIRSKDYYKNTTIVIVGDHLTMQSNLFSGKNANNRYVYNCIINPSNRPINNQNRLATALDYYPTIVYSIGGIIKEDRLGLGTNLFSEKDTLAEQYGFNKFSKELKKTSKFYNNEILSSKGR